MHVHIPLLPGVNKTLGNVVVVIVDTNTASQNVHSAHVAGLSQESTTEALFN